MRKTTIAPARRRGRPAKSVSLQGQATITMLPPAGKRLYGKVARPKRLRTPAGKDRTESPTAATLLNVALDLFARQNYSAVTIKDIAQATGMNAALVYYYFESKEGLFLRIVEATAEQAVNTFNAIRDQAASPRDIVSLWIENHALQFPLMQKLIKISIDYASTQNRVPAIDRAVRKFYDIEADILGQAIRSGIAQGIFVPVDVRRTTQFISTFLDGVLVRSVMMQEFDPQAAIHDLRDFVLRQLDVTRIPVKSAKAEDNPRKRPAASR